MGGREEDGTPCCSNDTPNIFFFLPSADDVILTTKQMTADAGHTSSEQRKGQEVDCFFPSLCDLDHDGTGFAIILDRISASTRGELLTDDKCLDLGGPSKETHNVAGTNEIQYFLSRAGPLP